MPDLADAANEFDVLRPGDVEQFRENGYLPARPLLATEEVARLRGAVFRILDGRSDRAPELMRNLSGDEENVVIQVVNAWEAEPEVFAYLFHPGLARAAATLMGTDAVRVWHDQVQYKPPRKGGPTVWHQDHPYWPVLEPADLVSAWLALDDADVENGCMSIVPRSHLWGRYGDGTVGIRPEDWGPAHDPAFVPRGESAVPVACPTPAGHVMFHHCMTWHGAPPNRSGRGRPAIAVHFMPGHTRYVPNAEHAIGHLIEVAPGEILQGEHFPLVWSGGPVLPPSLS